MKKTISIILAITLILSLALVVFAEDIETVGGKITLTQFLGLTPQETKGISLSYGGTTITANVNDFYAIADKIILTSQLDIKQTSMDGLFITVRKHDDTFEYAYITPNGEADKYSPLMSRLPYAMYIADDKEMVSELISLVTEHFSMYLPYWAETIERANAEGFIPENFGVSNFTENITREKFCDLAFSMLNKKIGMEHYEHVGAFLLNDEIEAMDYVENTEDYSLTNSVSKSMITLYDFDIIKGKREVRKPVEQDGYPFPFIDLAPKDFITREEAAVILYRIASFLEMELFLPDYRLSSYYFHDNDNISDWAKEAVYQLRYAGIFKGTDNDLFSPLGNYTIEQAIATMTRIFDLPSEYENAAEVAKLYFGAYETADYETMKDYSTTRHTKQDFHDGDVWGYKWAKLTSIKPVSRATDEGECIFNVHAKVETIPASSQYPDTEGGFYVILRFEDGAWKIDEFATGL